MKRLVLTATALLFAFVTAPTVRAGEIEDAVAMFSADDGLTAAEKLPALKAFMEAHRNEKGLDPLVKLLEKIAAEAGEKDVMAWWEEVKSAPAKKPTAKKKPKAKVKPEIVERPEEPEKPERPVILEKPEDQQKPGKTEDPDVQVKTTAKPAAAVEPSQEQPSGGDDETKALEELLNREPPTDEECQEAFAKLPPLKPLPPVKFEPVESPLSDAFINSADRRAAIINVKEALRVFIGEMSDEDERAFEEKWTAALEFPCKEVTDWLKRASPIVTEMVKIKVAIEAAFDEFEEALSDANIYRLNRLWVASHEAMREALAASARLQGAKIRMGELQSALAGLGEMPKAQEVKEARVARRKDAEAAVREYLMAEPSQKICGWYEAVGMRLEGPNGKPRRGRQTDKKALAAARWELHEPEEQKDASSSFWFGKRFYIRPIVKFEETGISVMYINMWPYQKDDDKGVPDTAWHNYKLAIEGDDGNLVFFWRSGEGGRVTIKPILSETGEDLISVVYSGVGIEGRCGSLVFRRTGGGTEDILPDALGEDSHLTFEKALEYHSAPGKAASYAEDMKSLMDGKDGFNKRVQGVLVHEMPPAKDVYYVLENAVATGNLAVEGARQQGTFGWHSTDDHYTQMLRKLAGTVESGPHKGQPRELRGLKGLKLEKPVVQTGLFSRSEKWVAQVYFHFDDRQLGDMTKFAGKNVPLDSFSKTLNVRWMPPPAVIRAQDGMVKMEYWLSSTCKRFAHAECELGNKISINSEWGGGESWTFPMSTNAHDVVEVGFVTTPEKIRGMKSDPERQPDSKNKRRNYCHFYAPSEVILHVDVQTIWGKAGAAYKYRRMVLTEEEAQKLLSENGGKMVESVRKEWDADEFKKVSEQIDEYLASLKKAEKHVEGVAESVAARREYMKFIEGNMERLEADMAKEVEFAEKLNDGIVKNAAFARLKAAELAKAEGDVGLKREDWWETLYAGGALTKDEKTGKLSISAAESDYQKAISDVNSLEAQTGIAADKAQREYDKAQKDAEEAGKRYADLYARYIGQKAQLEYEQAMIDAETTGRFVPPRTAFDAFCHLQLLEGARREVERDQYVHRLQREARRAIYDISGQDEANTRGTLLRLAKHHEEKSGLDMYEKAIKIYNTMPPANMESEAEWRAFAKMLQGVKNAKLQGDQAKAEEALVDADQRLWNAQVTKGGSTALLCLGALGAGSAVEAAAMHKLMMGHFVATGFAEGGVSGAVDNFIRFKYAPIDFVVGATEGYAEDGLRGLTLHAGATLAFHVGIPWLRSKVNFNASLSEIYNGTKEGLANSLRKLKSVFASAAATKVDKKAIDEYKKFHAEAVKRISDYVHAYNAVQTLNEKTMTNKEITRLRQNVVKAAARVNEHPEAKAILKTDPAYKHIGKKFALEMDRIYDVAVKQFNVEMAKRGFSRHDIKQFRNAASKGSVGMDADYGMAVEKVKVVKPNGKIAFETVKITQNGERSNLVKWQEEGQKAWNEAYKYSTFGVGDAKKAWGQITTSKFAEAYRSIDILKKTGTHKGMTEILNSLSLSDAQQIADVTYFKASEMLNSTTFPRMAMVYEACRGTAKDMATKFLPALDARIKNLSALKSAGKGFGKGEARELERLVKAREYYGKLYETYNAIGKHKLPPEKWDEEIRLMTGGEGILGSINNMGDLFKSLVFK